MARGKIRKISLHQKNIYIQVKGITGMSATICAGHIGLRLHIVSVTEKDSRVAVFVKVRNICTKSITVGKK